jgi:hypothetical protein
MTGNRWKRAFGIMAGFNLNQWFEDGTTGNPSTALAVVLRTV